MLVSLSFSCFPLDCCVFEMYGAHLMLFHVIFVYAWLERRELRAEAEPERGTIEVLASVYVCVWVSPLSLALSLSRSYSQQQAASLSSPHPSLLLSIFTCLIPSHSQAQFKSDPTFPCSLFIHLPTFTLLPVFVLQSGSWSGQSGF